MISIPLPKGTKANLRQRDWGIERSYKTPNGNKIWTRQFGTSSSDEGWGVSTDSNNNIYVTGYTLGSFGQDVTGDDNSNAGNIDHFLQKYHQHPLNLAH